MNILAGFTVPAGERFEIPSEGHLAWFGQTQLSGKTTALEAFVFRGRRTAIAFITKRGEGGFLTGRMIQPYFSEPTNDPEQPLWRWVKSILEASQRRNMNFQESWIIRACEEPRHATKLADVHANIKALLVGERTWKVKRNGKREEKWIRKPVSGMNAGIYTSLNAYFDIVMPQIERLPYSKNLALQPGLNVMDLREYAMETQALVIRSVMEWVYQHERCITVIVPEAQDFVPQTKNSPVKMACENLVRKGGADKNFMWLDSQDMAAVDKFALRACSIVGCGVQTEMHEIDRTLASMFTPHLKPVDVAQLKKGQFFVRTPEAKVSLVYVMPAWMDSEPHAQAIARGEISVDSASSMRAEFAKHRKSGSRGAGLAAQDSKPEHEPEASPQERTALHPPAPPQLLQLQIQTQDEPEEPTAADLRGSNGSKNGDEAVWKEKYDALVIEYDKLCKRVDELEADRAFPYEAKVPEFPSRPGDKAAVRADGEHQFSPSFAAALYQEIRKLAERDGILELLVRRPELRVKVERHTLKMDAKNLDGAIARMVHEGFFDSVKKRETIAAELRRRGALSPTANLKIISPPLAKLVEYGFLYRQSDQEFVAVPGMKNEIVQTAG